MGRLSGGQVDERARLVHERVYRFLRSLLSDVKREDQLAAAHAVAVV
jgi:hypothetical protein